MNSQPATPSAAPYYIGTAPLSTSTHAILGVFDSDNEICRVIVRGGPGIAALALAKERAALIVNALNAQSTQAPASLVAWLDAKGDEQLALRDATSSHMTAKRRGHEDAAGAYRLAAQEARKTLDTQAAQIERLRVAAQAVIDHRKREYLDNTCEPYKSLVAALKSAPSLPSTPSRETVMTDALKLASNLIPTARNHFPKSIQNGDRFQLELVCAAISKALNT